MSEPDFDKAATCAAVMALAAISSIVVAIGLVAWFLYCANYGG